MAELLPLSDVKIFAFITEPGLTLEGEVGEEVTFWTFTSLYKSLRAKLKSFCKFEKSLCEFVKSLEPRCKFHYVEEIIRKFLHLGAVSIYF